MKKNISYRDKLLELSRIYQIHEIKSYIRNKKYLTTAQIEHILKKNRVPIPTEINKSILEIHSKKIKRPFELLNSSLKLFVKNFYYSVTNLFIIFITSIKKIFLFFVESIFNFINFVKKITINILNNLYNFKVEEKKANKIVSRSVFVCFISFLILGAFQIKDIILEKDLQQLQRLEAEIKKPEKKSEVKVTKKKIEPIKKAEVKVTKKKIEPIKKAEVKAPDTKIKKVKEFVLPDLNLRTETVLSLFDDVEYDLKKVRKYKLVKPIYFTQFPKDLDEISSVQLKKETFIKIVLPLVVAENQKILDDKRKFLKISTKKNTSDNEKFWLRQKLKEYKIKNGSMAELLMRMDIIPVSIAIAQAAKESGWGTSRFALEGNAIFGQWTWNGRGIAPLDRAKNKNHKILRFPILRASVKAYKNNLNTHKSYKEFREARSKLRIKRKSIEGKKLIHTLDNYAQTGTEYTKILRQMIEQNSLDEFENVKLTTHVVKKELNL